MSENSTRAEAVREAARYLERIYRRGLQSRDSMLMDMEAVAQRMEQGMTARGSMRTNRTIRCDYCGDTLPSLLSRVAGLPTPDLVRHGFDPDKVVCPECAAARTDRSTER